MTRQILFCVIFLSSFFGHGAETLVIGKEFEEQDLSSHIEILLESSGSLSFNDAKNGKISNQFIDYEGYEIPEGASVHLTCGDNSSILEASSEAARLADQEIGDIQPRMVFFYSCMVRKIILGQRTQEELDCIRRVFGAEVPIIGFYTYGEYCRVGCGSPSLFHNETATVSVIGV